MKGLITLPRVLNLFIGFVVGVILMYLPMPHIFIVSDLLPEDLIDTTLQKILDTLGLILVCIFGYKIFKLVYKEG